MTERHRRFVPLSLLAFSALTLSTTVSGQNFDFERLNKQIRGHTVVLEMDVEVSFGVQTNDQKQRMLGTVVTNDGLIMFDGTFLWNDNLFSAISGLSIKTTPTRLVITTLDNTEFEAEYIGVDRFTQLGFARIVGPDLPSFHPISFVTDYKFHVGRWVALYMLLPEYVEPPLGADIGMISSLVELPENIPLTVGFGPAEVSSVLYDERLVPVGVLGHLMDPSQATSDASGMLESFGGSGVPLLGIITGERLKSLIANPPRKGEIDRAWLGISLQALTPDISSFLGLDVSGGIIVNDVVEQSPAFEAGIQVGDVIHQINGQPVDVDDEDKVSVFQRKIAEMGPGTSVEFSVFRPGQSSTDTLIILASLDAAPIAAADADEYESQSLELTVRNLVFSDYMANNLDREKFSGVAVSELKLGGLAFVGGLRLGDIIQRIDSEPVVLVEDIERIFDELVDDRPSEIIFFVWRNNKTLFVNVKTDWP